MILTTCAACAAPLAHNAPRCVRCKLRYCNATCQHDQTLFQPDDATRNEVNEAITTLEELLPVVRRVFGKTHPKVRLFQGTLDAAKAKLEFLEFK